jgi:hypothetical protein
VNVVSWSLSLAAACGAAAFAVPVLLAVIPVLLAANGIANQGLFRAWRETGGPGFGIAAAAYYLFVYPAAVAAGGFIGLLEHLAGRDRKRERCRHALERPFSTKYTKTPV